jgi:type II pantothenate kinase
MIVGIDIGGSTTDAVLLNDGQIVEVITIETGDPIAAAAGALGKLLSTAGGTLSDIQAIAASGGGARWLKEELFGVPISTVPEINAIGIGGSTLAEKSSALVVSLGTGTALVSIHGEQIEHVGGTGVGGGTLVGLARHLLGVTRLDTLEQMAAHGDLTHVDLTVGDITGGPVGIVPARATASNFGKVRSDPTPADKALALVNMVAEVTFTLSIVAARACHHHDIILTGKLTRVHPLRERVEALRPRRGENIIIPPYAEYATAIGAAQSLRGQFP